MGSTIVKYHIEDWRTQLAEAQSSDWKEVIYKLARPILSLLTRRILHDTTLAELRPSLVLPEKGFPLIARRRWALGQGDIHNKILLVQGTGNGWDLVSWARFRPRKIIGVDFYPFESWNEITRYVLERYSVEAEFHASPLSELSFIPDATIDYCVSDAVYEHIVDLYSVLKEMWRILKPGGVVYATYGPLWYCAGGDHFSGRGGLKNVFNHVLFDTDKYKQYFKAQRVEFEDFQSGGRYVELDLFSKLTTREYLQCFAQSGYFVEELILEVSREARLFRQMFPDMFCDLIARNPTVMEDDFLIKANFVRMRKHSTSMR
jgi:SAM-dependent methyltransferase